MTSVESIPQFLLGGLPIVQPKHLEGDSTFATEILPGPPPLLSVQQSGNRKDKKTSAPVSYLPASDPGTTYSVLGGVVTPVTTVVNADMNGSRRKRARTNKGAPSARPQRVSARVLNANSSTADMTANGHEATLAWSAHARPESSMLASSAIDVDEPMISRSISSEEIQSISTPVNGTYGKEKATARKDKGKAREKPTPTVRIKEEPVAITFSLNDYGPPLSNDDHCSSCQSFGSLVYCDGCPKAFHLWCLDPPMEPQDLPEGENRWFCPSCTIQDNPPPKPSASLKFMSPLIQQLQCAAPLEFRLPEEIRAGFKDVAAGSRGNYIDTSRLKPPRLNRHGQLEDRDPARLKDRSGDPILCFQCGTSALPSEGSEPPAAKRPRRASNKLANPESWKSMISCDYCDLNWHLDCIDPPITAMPAFGIKWMCPNHAEHVHKPKRRIPKQNSAFVEVTKPNQPNNGNIDVVPTEYLTPHESRLLVDEVMINGRRYRVPERIVKLDFWNKLNATQPTTSKPDSRSSSPLTSLSSLDDSDDEIPIKSGNGLYSLDDVLAAQVLFNIRAAETRVPENTSVTKTNGVTNGSRVETEPSASSSHTQPSTRIGKRKAEEATPEQPIQSTAEAAAPPPLGRRRSARKPAPVKRVKVEPSEETTTSDSSSPPVPSRSHKAAKPAAKASTAATKKSDAVSSKSNGKASTKPVPSTDPEVAIPATKAAKAKTSTSKPAKASTYFTVKIEPETSPKPPATPSLKIRLPRLNGLTPVSASTSTAPSRKDSTSTVPKPPKRKPSKKQLDEATYIS